MAIFTNQASVSYNGITVNSNIATGEITQSLSIEKISLSDSYTAGGEKTYVISIVNSCSAEVPGVTVTDNLGAYEFDAQTVYPLTYNEGTLAMFVNGVAAPAPTVSTDEGLQMSGITVPALSSVMLIYTATVNEFASPLADGEITNIATLSSATYAALSAFDTVTADSGALLTVSKSVSPLTVAGCEEITFTFVIQNTGNSPADENVVLTDNFEIALSDISVTLDGVALTQGTDYTFDETTGVFATVAGVITVPAAEFEQDETGRWVTNPSSAVLTIKANV